MENKRRSRHGKLRSDGAAESRVEWDVGGRLSYLPSVVQFSSEYELLVSSLPPSRIGEAYALICAAALKGDNIGLDEFPDEATLRQVIELSDAYIGQDPVTGAMKALMVIEPSNLCRSEWPLYADAYLVIEQEVYDKKVYGAIVRLMVQFIADLGYEGMLVNTFSRHTTSIHALRNEGFLVVGSLPFSGYLANKGWAESLVLFKDLTVGGIKVII